ncbi:MAG: DUF1844 domain-containing protein [Pyrinomonadaceae bacterium]
MIGRDDNEEEVSYKVADKRKFNADGSLRDGVVLEAAKVEEPKAEPTSQAEEPQAATEPVEGAEHQDLGESAIDDGDYADDGEEIPGSQDPASFVNFLSMLATNAATALGAVPNPATGKRMLDLDTGKYWLDVLGMIKEKTNNNLHPQEARLLDGLLGDLRMQYVQLVRATEEKLKAQAAQQFSGADILGKK